MHTVCSSSLRFLLHRDATFKIIPKLQTLHRTCSHANHYARACCTAFLAPAAHTRPPVSKYLPDESGDDSHVLQVGTVVKKLPPHLGF